jgi:flagellar biosynthesis protein FlhG
MRIDQAQGLRALAKRARDGMGLDSSALVSPRRTTRVVAITSGKGGVGKTHVSTNLALLLGQTGKRVIVLDADLGLANIHVVLGIHPQYHLEHVLRNEKSLRDILISGPSNIHIIAGASGIAELANLSDSQREKFVHQLSELEDLADTILIDTSAGLSPNVLAFVLAVDEVIVITTPEPTSITDAYAIIKIIARDNPTAHLHLIVNMVTNETEAFQVAERMKLVCQKFLHVDLHILGYLPYDNAISRAVREQRPFALYSPLSPCTRALSKIVEGLGYTRPALNHSSGVTKWLNRMARLFKEKHPETHSLLTS